MEPVNILTKSAKEIFEAVCEGNYRDASEKLLSTDLYYKKNDSGQKLPHLSIALDLLSLIRSPVCQIDTDFFYILSKRCHLHWKTFLINAVEEGSNFVEISKEIRQDLLNGIEKIFPYIKGYEYIGSKFELQLCKGAITLLDEGHARWKEIVPPLSGSSIIVGSAMIATLHPALLPTILMGAKSVVSVGGKLIKDYLSNMRDKEAPSAHYILISLFKAKISYLTKSEDVEKLLIEFDLSKKGEINESFLTKERKWAFCLIGALEEFIERNKTETVSFFQVIKILTKINREPCSPQSLRARLFNKIALLTGIKHDSSRIRFQAVKTLSRLAFLHGNKECEEIVIDIIDNETNVYILRKIRLLFRGVALQILKNIGELSKLNIPDDFSIAAEQINRKIFHPDIIQQHSLEWFKLRSLVQKFPFLEGQKTLLRIDLLIGSINKPVWNEILRSAADFILSFDLEQNHYLDPNHFIEVQAVLDNFLYLSTLSGHEWPKKAFSLPKDDQLLQNLTSIQSAINTKQEKYENSSSALNEVLTQMKDVLASIVYFNYLIHAPTEHPSFKLFNNMTVNNHKLSVSPITEEDFYCLQKFQGISNILLFYGLLSFIKNINPENQEEIKKIQNKSYVGFLWKHSIHAMRSLCLGVDEKEIESKKTERTLISYGCLENPDVADLWLTTLIHLYLRGQAIGVSKDILEFYIKGESHFFGILDLVLLNDPSLEKEKTAQTINIQQLNGLTLKDERFEKIRKKALVFLNRVNYQIDNLDKANLLAKQTILREQTDFTFTQSPN